MLNKTIILINGISRSGSNLLWNIMQSHPDVCSPVGETNRVLHPQFYALKLCTRFLYMHLPVFMTKRVIDRILHKWKQETLHHPANRWKTKDTLYTPEEVNEAVLCTKSLNEDIFLTDIFYSIYPDIHTIGLIRNGYALCEGKKRRGIDPEKAGKMYARYMSKIIKDSQRYPNYTCIKFEDLAADPFSAAERLYKFCGLEPASCTHLRLKYKGAGSLSASTDQGQVQVGEKYWLDRSCITSFVNPRIDAEQSKLLDEADRKLFNKYGKPILEYFSYI